jgi:uncharacterized NAD(P)/FAD-binding protein YdhS
MGPRVKSAAFHFTKPSVVLSCHDMSNKNPAMPKHDLLIVGGGFGACAALAWLARFAPAGLRVAVLSGSQAWGGDTGHAYGCGLAYGDQDPVHLLNAAHWNMGLLDHEPDGFTHWLSATRHNAAQLDFVPRADYGAFLEAQWQASLHALAARGVVVRLIEYDAIAIDAVTEQSVTILDDAGASHSSAALLVCAGPTLLPFSGLSHQKVITPLWPCGLRRLKDARGHVAIIGTGLSGVDAAISALAEPGVTKVTMISRDGRLPLAHDVTARQKLALHFKGTPLAVLRAVRAAAREAPWQAVMNALRGQTNTLWAAWTQSQRRSALRHLSGIWAAHRNRLPAEVLTQIANAQAKGALEVIKSAVTLHETGDGRLNVQLERLGTSIQPDWVIDARGFARITEDTDTFLGKALCNGHVKPSSLGYGITGDSTHRASHHGLAPIHVVGAARLGDLIETTGAPEVRTQVRESLEALFTVR